MFHGTVSAGAGESVLEVASDAGDAAKHRACYRRPLDRPLENGEMVSFMSYIFYHNKHIFKRKRK